MPGSLSALCSHVYLSNHAISAGRRTQKPAQRCTALSSSGNGKEWEMGESFLATTGGYVALKQSRSVVCNFSHSLIVVAAMQSKPVGFVYLLAFPQLQHSQMSFNENVFGFHSVVLEKYTMCFMSSVPQVIGKHSNISFVSIWGSSYILSLTFHSRVEKVQM